MFAMFLHAQELRPCLSEKIFLSLYLFSKILILVISIVQPGLLLNEVKNVGLRFSAMYGQHRLVRLLGLPVSEGDGKSTNLVRFIGKTRMIP